MALTESNMLAIGTKAPDFILPEVVSNTQLSLEQTRGDKATVVMFICNHCPYVIHVIAELVNIANQYKSKGVNFVAISSNDVINYPEDAPDKMSIVSKVMQFPFPYLYDKTQEVAKAYDAACTPDLYVFDETLSLVYRGRMDGSRPGNQEAVTGANLRSAIDATLLGVKDIQPQIPSAGCNIKWLK